MWRAGDSITPEVQLVRPLAEGSMGQVWAARHRALGIDVAVKLIGRGVVEDDDRRRLEREARAASEIASPHVARVFDHGRTPAGDPFMVMELLEGEPLDTRLEREGRVALDEVAALVTQIADALDRAHAAGIVHRDVKPANLFLARTAHGTSAKLLDFGVAKWMGTDGADGVLTADGSLVGTPHYMSPEQIIHGSRLSIQVDLWSLAVVAYECLAGRRPFEAATLDDLSLTIFASRFPRLTEIRPDLSPGLDMFFARAFRKKVDERYTDVRAMATAFEDLSRRHRGYDEDAATAPRHAHHDPD
ncbi:MAG TPA: serine/threonine protein kinase [Polyangiaceae bacterium]|nr:serine/threonine protein kinase [Polyangiaceae bacterium]